VTVSFLEVYNENIRDLLSENEESLDLREDPIKGPVVSGITEVQAQSAEEIMGLLHKANRCDTRLPNWSSIPERPHADDVDCDGCDPFIAEIGLSSLQPQTRCRRAPTQCYR
jgi:hypothetical protein